MRNPNFILLISICLLYYLLFMYKGDKEWKRILLIATTGGFIASIATILEGVFVSLQSIITNIALVLGCIILVSYFYFGYAKIWKIRKEPENRFVVYAVFGWTIVFVLLIVVIFILAFFTDFFG